MSMCEAPPQRKKRMVDLAGFRIAGVSGAGAVIPRPLGAKRRPAKPMVEAARKVRRFIGGWKRAGFMVVEGDAGRGGYNGRTLGRGGS
jgi:hypothetical protein